MLDEAIEYLETLQLQVQADISLQNSQFDSFSFVDKF